MDTQPPQPSDPATLASNDHLVQALRTALPPPLGRTPEDIARRNAAAIALALSLKPADAAEAALVVKYVVTGAHMGHCLWLARRGPPATGLTVRMRSEAASYQREGMHFMSLLLTLQANRRKREATGMAARQASPQHAEGHGAGDSLAPPSGAAVAPPVQPPTPPETTKPAPPRRSPPTLRLIQGGLAT